MGLEEEIAQSLADKVEFPENFGNEKPEGSLDLEQEQEEGSSLKNENNSDTVAEDNDTPEQDADKEVVVDETPQVNVDEIREQLRQELSQEYESKQPQFANETIAKLNELAKGGIDIDSQDFWKWQYTDLDNYDTSNKSQAMELVQLELELENPNLNERQINRLLKKSYGALFDESFSAEDTEYQEAMEDLSIDAIRSVTKLKKHKESVQLPKVDIQKKEQEEAAQKAAHEAFLKDVRKEVQAYNEEPIKLDKDLEIKYIPNDDTKKFVESSIINNQSWFVDNYTKDNKIDYPRLKRDMARIHDFDNIVKTVYEQGISVGKGSIVDTLENAGENVSQEKQEKAHSYLDQIHEQFANQNSRKR